MTGRATQGGVALITAMLITALVGTVALSLMWNSALDVRRTMVLLNRDQAVQVALGAESWIQSILQQDFAESETDHLGELWASELPGLPIDGGEVFGAIEDLQGRFNVNNLTDNTGEIDQEALEQFQRLLNALGLDPRFAGIAADWIDSNIDPAFPDGAEDTLYSTALPPYRTPNAAISSASELAALDGMTQDVFTILAPHIVALPRGTRLNVNTATAAVLQSLDDRLSPGDAERLLAERADAGFADVVQAFNTLVEPDVLNELVEESEYFQLKLSVRIDTVRITYSSTLMRSAGGDVVPILRSFGSFL